MMRKNKRKYILISSIIICLAVLISINFYTETYGYPWKHAQIKKEAVGYMKEKYNMNIKAAGSSFNAKFDYYTDDVYCVNDGEKNLIRVEKQRFFDEKTQAAGERLEDNYSQVYWEKRINDEMKEKYPNFYKLDDVEKMNMDIAYFTTPLENGVSSAQDENGVYIPLKPDYNGILQIDLKTNDLSEEFLAVLLFVIKDIKNTQLKVDLVVTGKNEASGTGNNTERTTMLNLEYEMFKDISSIEDLKKVKSHPKVTGR